MPSSKPCSNSPGITHFMVILSLYVPFETSNPVGFNLGIVLLLKTVTLTFAVSLPVAPVT